MAISAYLPLPAPFCFWSALSALRLRDYPVGMVRALICPWHQPSFRCYLHAIGPNRRHHRQSRKAGPTWPLLSPPRLRVPLAPKCCYKSNTVRLFRWGQFGFLAILLFSCTSHAPPPSAVEGRSLYESTGCASCHGRTGAGDGPLAAKVPAKPIDLHVSALFKRGASVDEIARTLGEGIAIDHSNPELHRTHHELVMPKFDHLTETERRSIALYVISLFTDVDHGRSQP